MENNYRLHYALEHVLDKPVFIVEREEWVQMVDVSGEPTKFEYVPASL